MHLLTMMASFTHSFRKTCVEVGHWLACLCVVGLLCSVAAWAQTSGEISLLQIDRLDDDLTLSAQVQFELPSAVEEVLTKGIPVTFTAEAEIYRERWYWFDRRLSLAQRSFRLSFLPLSRRWRVTVAAPTAANGAALSLNQSFDTLREAMEHMTRISKWRVADATVLDPALPYRLEFRYRLDVTQLALPMQIGTLGQTDWNVTLSASKAFTAPAPR